MEASTAGNAGPGVPARGGLAGAVWPLAGVAVLAQICYPLLSGPALQAVTIAAVLLFAAAAALHAAASLGPAAAAAGVLLTAGIALGAEAIGLRTGIPFGRYSYAATLGPQLLGVPLVVLAAWVMMAYPCLLLARRLAAARPGPGRRARVAVAGALALAGWDLFLDPQLVAAGQWTWAHAQPALPGVPGVPLTDYAGWLAVGVVLIALLDAVLPPARPPRAGSVPGPGAPAALLAWTWLGSTLADAAFFDRPAVAAYGFAGLGLTVAPYLLLLRRDAALRRAPARRHEPAPRPAGQPQPAAHPQPGAWPGAPA